MTDFELDDLEIENYFDITTESYNLNKNRYIKPKIFHNITEKKVKYKNAQNFINDLSGAIFNKERIFALISGSFVFGDIVECLVYSTKKRFKNITISTLSMNEENIFSFENCIDSKRVDNFNLIVSDYYFAHNRDEIRLIYKTLDKDNIFQLAVCGTHTKMILIEIDDGQKIVIHGSANLRSSSSLEQIMIETNSELYDFSFEFHNAIIEKYSTIKKSIRGNNLWDIIK